MKELSKLPEWAFELAAPEHRHRAIAAHENGTLAIIWPDSKSLKTWAKQKGWRVAWFNFKKHFVNEMLENDINFELVLKERKLKISIPIEYYKISGQTLQTWDTLYEEQDDKGVPGLRQFRWGHLVESLREIRRLVEAGTVIEIESKKIENFNEFMTWVHHRYKLLEEGYDSWVGDDKS